MDISRRQLLAGSISAGALGVTSVALAQTYPTKAVRMVIPTSVGTPVDILSRVAALQMAPDLGEPVIAEDKASSGGIVGMQEVLRQPADGYNMIMVYRGMVLTPYLFDNVTIDLLRDFAPVGQCLFTYNVLVVSPKLGVNSIKELVDLIKAKGGQLSFASGGIGSPAHLAGELFSEKLGVKLIHVPYVTFPSAIQDVIGGRVEMMFAASAPAMGQIQSGNLKALAVTSTDRLPPLKDVPTMRELGYPEVTLRDWNGLMVKSGTPKGAIERLNSSLLAILKSDEVRRSFAQLGAEPVGGSPESFGGLIAEDTKSLLDLIRRANIRQ